MVKKDTENVKGWKLLAKNKKWVIGLVLIIVIGGSGYTCKTKWGTIHKDPLPTPWTGGPAENNTGGQQ